jgi:peptidylprolyl isomerase
MRLQALLATIVLTACASGARPADGPARSLGEILEQAPAFEWRTLDPNNTLYMELPAGRVIIELSPDFSPEHVENVRAFARARYWDGAAILRSQDNYVVQWGRVEGDERDRGAARTEIEAPEFYRRADGLSFTRLPDADSYAPQTGFTNGFPAGRNGRGETWMLHCYGIVGVGRGVPPNTGDGSELYVVIGQSPRHLDRNLAMVGRVVQGMELLSAMPRGGGALGFYQTEAERTVIRAVRLASDVPPEQRTNLEVMRTDSASFREVIDSRRFRREAFFVEPTGRINACNVPIPVRVQP